MKRKWKVLIAVVVLVVGTIAVFAGVKYSHRGIVTVETGKVVRQDLTSLVTASGEIKPRKYINIGANATGQLTEIPVKEGDLVRKGQLLARIENTQPEADVNAQNAGLSATEADAAAASGSASAAIAGEHNQASGDWSDVSGGEFNLASDPFSAISGGCDGVAGTAAALTGACGSTGYESISGGVINRAQGLFSSVSAGQQNQATGYSTAVGGGDHNTAGGSGSGNFASVTGGGGNVANGDESAIAGGQYNLTTDDDSFIAGAATTWPAPGRHRPGTASTATAASRTATTRSSAGSTNATTALRQLGLGRREQPGDRSGELDPRRQRRVGQRDRQDRSDRRGRLGDGFGRLQPRRERLRRLQRR